MSIEEAELAYSGELLQMSTKNTSTNSSALRHMAEINGIGKMVLPVWRIYQVKKEV